MCEQMLYCTSTCIQQEGLPQKLLNMDTRVQLISTSTPSFIFYTFSVQGMFPSCYASYYGGTPVFFLTPLSKFYLFLPCYITFHVTSFLIYLPLPFMLSPRPYLPGCTSSFFLTHLPPCYFFPSCYIFLVANLPSSIHLAFFNVKAFLQVTYIYSYHLTSIPSILTLLPSRGTFLSFLTSLFGVKSLHSMLYNFLPQYTSSFMLHLFLISYAPVHLFLPN
jgi:hypothetical protein